MKVTVLMPIYNAERFLHDSISSLINQTSGDWKLICIDDGSTDGSAAIVEEYCCRDERIKIIKQANAGPAVARANAISIADTEYVSILDSDDAYCLDYVERMLKRAKETDADIIVPDVAFGYGNTKKIPNIFFSHHLDESIVIEDGVQGFSMTIPWQLHGWPMVKTSFAQRYYTLENASYSNFNSDEYISRLLYLKSKKTVLCSACYLYRIDSNSITRLPSLKKLDYLTTLDKLLNLVKLEHIPSKIVVEIYNEFYKTLKDMLKLASQLEPNESKQAFKIIHNSYKYSYKKNLDSKILLSAKVRTKIKFIYSLLGLWTFKGVNEYKIALSNKIKFVYYNTIKRYHSLMIRNKNVSVISNNCWGGFMYQSCNLPYNTPFIGLYMYAPEYIALLRNLKENLKQPIRFISTEESKYKHLISRKYIIGVLGNTGIEIVFMHYRSEDEVLEKWQRRLSRLDYNNLIVKFSDTDECSDALVEEFDKMQFEHKICFTGKPYPCLKSVKFMKEYAINGCVHYEWAYSYRYYNFVKEANRIMQRESSSFNL